MMLRINSMIELSNILLGIRLLIKLVKISPVTIGYVQIQKGKLDKKYYFVPEYYLLDASKGS
jgi:hypothetical protein